MHNLFRQVRFSINPFLDADKEGFNSFASKPCGEGLAIFFELEVEVRGKVNEATGFVINVVDIDRLVREHVVPIFGERIRKEFRAGETIGMRELASLLQAAREELNGKFGKAKIGQVSLKLNPYRKISSECEDIKMVFFSEKFEFAAMHKLWNDEYSEEKNFEVFGKCSNPAGHGHNYTVEVTVKMGDGAEGFGIGEFERIVNSELIELIDHKNLNEDVAGFREVNPTVENITRFSWERLATSFGGRLHCITVWETEKTSCSYYGE